MRITYIKSDTIYSKRELLFSGDLCFTRVRLEWPQIFFTHMESFSLTIKLLWNVKINSYSSKNLSHDNQLSKYFEKKYFILILLFKNYQPLKYYSYHWYSKNELFLKLILCLVVNEQHYVRSWYDIHVCIRKFFSYVLFDIVLTILP